MLRHVRSSADKRAADEIADRNRCEDFETFKPLFERVQADEVALSGIHLLPMNLMFVRIVCISVRLLCHGVAGAAIV